MVGECQGTVGIPPPGVLGKIRFRHIQSSIHMHISLVSFRYQDADHQFSTNAGESTTRSGIMYVVLPEKGSSYGKIHQRYCSSFFSFSEMSSHAERSAP
jgi:hypothetical protein